MARPVELNTAARSRAEGARPPWLAIRAGCVALALCGSHASAQRKPPASSAHPPAAAVRREHATAPAPTTPSAPPPATAASATASLNLTFTGFKNDDGQALVAVFASEAGFPQEVSHAVWRKALAIHDRRVRVTVEGLHPGRVAVALIHDANKDFKLATGLFGIPTEGYGVSRDAPANFGPPKFADAAVVLAPGETKQLVINVRY